MGLDESPSFQVRTPTQRQRAALQLDDDESSMLGFDPVDNEIEQQGDEDMRRVNDDYAAAEEYDWAAAASATTPAPQPSPMSRRVKSHSVAAFEATASQSFGLFSKICQRLSLRRGRKRIMTVVVATVAVTAYLWQTSSSLVVEVDPYKQVLSVGNSNSNSSSSSSSTDAESLQSTEPLIQQYAATAAVVPTNGTTTTAPTFVMSARPDHDNRNDHDHCTHLLPSNESSYASLPLPNQINLGDKLLFLHMGKAGGGAVKARLQLAWNVSSYSYCHPSPKRCHIGGLAVSETTKALNVPEWIQQHYDSHNKGVVLMNVRDPVDRFASAYYWRQYITCRPNQPQYGNRQESRSPHTSGSVVAKYPDTYCRRGTPEDMEILFGSLRYNQSANALAKAVCSANASVATQAAMDMRTIVHANVGILDWLNGELSLSHVLANTQSLLLVVQEPGYDLLAQVDDAVSYFYNVTRFESGVDFANRQKQVNYMSCVDGASNASLYSAASSRRYISSSGAACLSRFYAAEYTALEKMKDMACRTSTCQEAIGSILSRRAVPAATVSNPAISDHANASESVPQRESIIRLGADCTPLPNEQRQRLEFVHIPKTGGSSIEAVALLHNISWSTCHWLDRIITIPGIPDCPKHPKRALIHHPTYKMSYWHLPPQLLDDGSFSPYDGAQLFAVVRNPYSRLISEWNYLPGLDRNNATALNAWVQGYLRQMIQAPDQPFVAADGHFMQQHLFFESNQSVIMIRQEQLNDDFDCLMNKYGYNMTLPTRRHNPNKGGALSARNLTSPTVQMIQTVYAKDFELFGYSTWYGEPAKWRQHSRRRR